MRKSTHSHIMSLVVFCCALIYTAMLAHAVDSRHIPVFSLPVFVLSLPAVFMFIIAILLTINAKRWLEIESREFRYKIRSPW